MREIDVSQTCMVLELNDNLLNKRAKRARRRFYGDVAAMIALVGLFFVIYGGAIALGY